MKPQRLTLSGFKGVRDGLGMKTFTLEFNSLAQLIALKGRNGRGKTTLIDNLQPYRLLPSKVDGSWSPKAVSFYEALDAPSATKDLVWSHQGKHFRSLCEWKLNGKTRTCAAYLFEIIDGVERAYALADGVICDGKTDNYDRAIEEILGPPEVFFTSAFSAQGKKPISAMQTGDAKRWLGNLLNQAPIRALGDRAKQVAKVLMQELLRQRVEATKLSQLREASAHCTAAVVADRALLEQANAARQTANVVHAQAVLNLRQAQAPDGAAAAIEQQRQRLLSQRAQQETTVTEISARLASQRQAEELRLRNHRQHCQSHADVQARTRKVLTTGVQECASLLARTEEINALNRRRISLVDSTNEREFTLLPTARAAVEAKRNRQTEITALETKLNSHRSQYESLKGIAVRAELAQSVPCHGSALNATCQLLSDAREAFALEPDAKAKLATLTQTGTQVRLTLDQQKEALAKLVDPGTLLSALEAKQREERQALAALAHVPGLVDALATAEPKHLSAVKALSDWEQDLALEVQRLAEAEALTAASAQEHIAALTAQLQAAQNALECTAKSLAELPAPQADGIASLQKLLDVATTQLQICQARESELQNAISAGCAKQITLDAQVVAALSAQEKSLAIEKQIAQWNLLADALSDKGIIALEIDAAGPSIATEANRLLQSCYGARFSVELSTLVANADGTMKEGFDIIVHDSQNNDTRPMSALSGGQRVWVNEAIIRSVAVYLAQAGERRYDTLFTDEVDGALDPERKHAFMAMKLALLKMGYFSREIFITQTPELLDYADQVIDLDALAQTI